MQASIQNVYEKISAFAEYAEFKRVLDRVAVLMQERSARCLGVLSENPGEGKTLFCAAIAASLAKSQDNRILVVDTQTYPSEGALSIEEVLEVENHPSPDISIRKTMRMNVDFLSIQHFLRAGMEQQLKEIIDRHRESYSSILFDTSALSRKNRRNIDPWIVARHMDANILVVGEETLRDYQQRIIEKNYSGLLRLGGLIYNEGAHART